MSIEDPPNKTHAPDSTDDVAPLREDKALLQGSDEFFAVLSPLLEEVTRLQGENTSRQEASDLVLLLENNALLRTLAITLSNLLGDLPERGAHVTRRPRPSS